LRQSNQRLEERLRAVESSFIIIRRKYQEALNDRAHFEKELTSALELQARLREKAVAKDEREVEPLSDDIMALKDKIKLLEKQALTAENNQAFFSNQYQIASAEAHQASLQTRTYEEELKALKPKCADNAVEIHRIHNEPEIAQHLETIKKLTEEKAEYERKLERRTEELKALMNGRRATTRGT
jgi:chromosome segregation ATPase